MKENKKTELKKLRIFALVIIIIFLGSSYTLYKTTDTTKEMYTYKRGMKW